MSKIVLGNAGPSQVAIDLELLLRTRALVTANSGGGKSYGLRLCAEQISTKFPVWIIDIDGEFSTLRPKFPFVLVGKGGETPADPRSVEVVVDRLLEHGASAIFDLYELKPQARHHYVHVLLEALMNAPKERWRNLFVMLDEAHAFAPEKGQGESEAYGSVVDLATRGRKRGFCLMAFTQRLAKISKNVTAELLNRLVGMTFEDIDVESAANVLSVARADRDAFRREVKGLTPGNFYGLGPAISRDRLMIKIGRVVTKHPEPGDCMVLSAPPTPDKIKALLPKLADLPKEAEEKARTEGELRAEIRSLKAQLVAKERWAAPTKAVAQTKVERVEVPAIKPKELVRFERAMANALTAAGKCADVAKMIRGFHDAIGDKVKMIEASRRRPEPVLTPMPSIGRAARPQPIPPQALSELKAQETFARSSAALSPAMVRILKALAEFAAIGRVEVGRTWVAARAGASHRSSAFANNLGYLRTSGLIEYRSGGLVSLTVTGASATPPIHAPLTTAEMQESCLRILSPAQQRILRGVIQVYPQGILRDVVAEKAEASVSSSAFANNLGALRSAGMIEYTPDRLVKASDWLFLD